jgi:Histidinol-phosphate/aromatic aminotransferase and cobyric acid decarboxylase
MRAHGGNIYDFAGRERMLDFSSNINPYGPPAEAMEAARKALDRVVVYPDVEQAALRAAVSAWLDVDPDALVFGNGASELIYAAVSAFSPRRLVVVAPTFSEYADAGRREGIPVAEVAAQASDGFACPVAGMLAEVREGDLLVACQPNNPTGQAWNEADFRTLADGCASRGALLMVDECFVNLTYPAAASALKLVPGGNVLVLRAMTKDFSAPGLRVGFLVAPPERADSVRRRLQPWPLNCVGEAFALACARRPEPFLRDSAERIAQARGRLCDGLLRCGYRPVPARANFILVRGDAPDTAERLYAALSERSVLIRRCANFSGLDGSYFRIAVKLPEENEFFLSALASI